MERKLLVFSSSTCGPCRMMAPLIEAVTQELQFPYEKLMSHERPEEFAKFGVSAVPTLVIVDEDGNELDRHVGAMPKPKLKEFLG